MIELDATFESLPDGVRETVVTVGTFDGVHRGHVDVVERLVRAANASGRTSLLVTFDPHPLEVVRPQSAPPLLTTRREKLAVLATTGIQYVAVLPFTAELANYAADEFVDRILRERFRMAGLLIGHDHGFGRGRSGDVETLRALGAARGFEVDVVEPVLTASGDVVSSTAIRSAIARGDLQDAEARLGRRYSVAGIVEHGDARGRTLGFPTLNVWPDSPRKLLPGDGVYAVEVTTPRGRLGGMMNLGGRPTFGDERRGLEAHLFDVRGEFYGDAVEVGFVARLRAVERFESSAALMAQLAMDEQHARHALTLARSAR